MALDIAEVTDQLLGAGDIPPVQDLIADQSGQQQWAERLARIFAEIEVELRAERLA